MKSVANFLLWGGTLLFLPQCKHVRPKPLGGGPCYYYIGFWKIGVNHTLMRPVCTMDV